MEDMNMDEELKNVTVNNGGTQETEPAAKKD